MYQGELVVLVMDNQEVINKYLELKSSGELESYINRIFKESILGKPEEETPNVNKNQIDEILNEIGGLKKLLEVNSRRSLANSSTFNEAAPTLVKPISNDQPNDLVTQENTPNSNTPEEKPVSAKIKQGTKKKGLNMNSLLSKAQKMK